MWLCHWVLNRGWKNFETHDRKSLGCLKEIIGRNMDIKGATSGGSDRNVEHSGESFYHPKEYLCSHKQNGGNIYDKDDSVLYYNGLFYIMRKV